MTVNEDKAAFLAAAADRWNRFEADASALIVEYDRRILEARSTYDEMVRDATADFDRDNAALRAKLDHSQWEHILKHMWGEE